MAFGAAKMFTAVWESMDQSEAKARSRLRRVTERTRLRRAASTPVRHSRGRRVRIGELGNCHHKQNNNNNYKVTNSSNCRPIVQSRTLPVRLGCCCWNLIDSVIFTVSVINCDSCPSSPQLAWPVLFWFSAVVTCLYKLRRCHPLWRRSSTSSDLFIPQKLLLVVKLLPKMIGLAPYGELHDGHFHLKVLGWISVPVCPSPPLLVPVANRAAEVHAWVWS